MIDESIKKTSLSANDKLLVYTASHT